MIHQKFRGLYQFDEELKMPSVTQELTSTLIKSLQGKKDCFILLCLVEKGLHTTEEVKQRVSVEIRQPNQLEIWLLDGEPFAKVSLMDLTFDSSIETVTAIAEIRAYKLF